MAARKPLVNRDGDLTDLPLGDTLDYADPALLLKADLASPALTGIPTAPTAPVGTATTQIATTGFVRQALNTTIRQETPLGVLDGSNATFTSRANFIPGSVAVYLNGLRLSFLADFNTSDQRTITLLDAPTSTETIEITYHPA